MRKKIPFLILFTLCFLGKVIAQSTQNLQSLERVKEISKFLAGQNDISCLTSKKDIYTFNIRIKLKKVGNLITVSNIMSTDSIGYKVFKNYRQLAKLNYKGLITKTGYTTLVIPILIINNPKAGRNPDESNLSFSQTTITDVISSLLYKDVVQENITIFPLFKIVRLDIS